MRERRPWGEEEVELAKRLLSMGMTIGEVSSALGRSRDSIRSLIRRVFKQGEGPLEHRSSPKGIIDMDEEEVLKLIGINVKLRTSSKRGDKSKKYGGRPPNGARPSALSDEEAAQVILQYLRHNRNLEGASALWKLHLSYKARGGPVDW